MSTQTIYSEIIQDQRKFFQSGHTRPVEFRIKQLQILKQLLKDYETKILEAVKLDMHKSNYEGFISEIGGTILEINYALKRVKKWVKIRNIRGPLSQFKAGGRVYSEPRGIVLIMGPWNYPVNLVLTPLIGAIAAGNCAILKPSELAPNSSHVLAELINNTYDSGFVHVIEGGIPVSQELLKQKFDYIFFTGGTRIGHLIMEAAAKSLTPVTLELGGKSPCIIDRKEKVNIKSSSEYIVAGKFLNCGQTCIAPDYLFVHNSIKDDLILALKDTIKNFYGEDPSKSPDYSRIINKNHFDRLASLCKADGTIVVGGECKPAELYIAPTVIDNITTSAKIMEEEIFGPLLPILVYDDLTEVVTFINSRPKPLALYVFSKDKEHQEYLMREIPFGGGCINDTVVHPSLPQMPFGGIGESGLGAYHGKHSFDTFSHMKSVFIRSPRFDLTKKFRFPPYGNKLNLVRRFLK